MNKEAFAQAATENGWCVFLMDTECLIAYRGNKETDEWQELMYDSSKSELQIMECQAKAGGAISRKTVFHDRSVDQLKINQLIG